MKTSVLTKFKAHVNVKFTFGIQLAWPPRIYVVSLIQLFRFVLSDNVLFFPHNTLSSKCRPCWLYYSVQYIIYIQHYNNQVQFTHRKYFIFAELSHCLLFLAHTLLYQPSHGSRFGSVLGIVDIIFFIDVCILILSILYILIKLVNRPVYNNIFLILLEICLS